MKLILIFILAISSSAYARPGSYQASSELRKQIEQIDVDKTTIAESIVLPISRGFSQTNSNLCWVFATLNALETNYLVKHPESKIEISRGAMQLFAMEDRLKNFIMGYQDNMSEGGLEVEAINLIRKNGLVHFNDYHNYMPWEILPIRESLELASQDQKDEILKTELNNYFGELPPLTQLDDITMDRYSFANNVLGDQEWVELYASEKVEGWMKEPDPDSRYNTQVYATSKQNLIKAMKASLKDGNAFTWGTTRHAMMIYGADFDIEGNANVYYVKDSSEPFTYLASSKYVHAAMVEVTVLKKYMPKL